MRIANPATGKRQCDRENNPADSNPRGLEGFLENPDHDSRGGPGVGNLGGAEVARVDEADALCEPIESGDNRQRAKRMPGNGAPGMHVVGIGSEGGVDGQATKNVRMPADGAMRERTRSFGQNHCEGDEGEGLPKFGNFVPDKQSKESRACRGKETTQSALLGIVAMQREPGGEIEGRAENGQSQQAHGHVGVLRRLKMQIDRGCPEESDEAKQSVLHLQMAGFKRTRDGGQSKHECS